MKKRFKLLIGLIIIILATGSISSMEAYKEDGKNDDYSRDLEKVILKAKSIVEIPEDFGGFDQNVYSGNDGRLIFNLTWFNEEDYQGEVNMTLDQDLFLKDYRFNRPDDLEGLDNAEDEREKISENQALDLAYEFIYKANKIPRDELLLNEDLIQRNLNSPYYTFSFTRLIEGIPFSDHQIYINIYKEDGEVKSLNMDWNNNLDIARLDKKIDLKEAEKSYREKIGIDLVYRTKYDYKRKDAERFLTYRVEDPRLGILAKDGSLVKILRDDFISENAKDGLGKEEIREIDSIKNIIDKDKAEKLARDYAGLKAEYKVENSFFNKYSGLGEKSQYSWTFYFLDGDENRASLSIDASTGELLMIYINREDVKGKSKLADKELMKIGEDFVKKHFKGDFNELRLSDRKEDEYLEEDRINLSYKRYYNDIRVEGDSVSVELDKRDGSIVAYNKTWSSLDFPDAKVKLNKDQALDSLLSKVGLREEYIIYKRDQATSKIYIDRAYRLRRDTVYNISVEDGSIIDYNGEKYIEEKAISYEDIDSSYAKDYIKTLARMGVGFEGERFYPEKELSQLEFLYLLIKANDFSLKSLEDEELIYERARDLKIIKEEEREPNSTITRAQAVKFTLRMSKYNDLIKKDIFKDTFKDLLKLDREEKAYIALAYGLDIIRGDGKGNFYPEKALTRQDGASIIVESIVKN